METKICKKCKIEKPLSDFSKHIACRNGRKGSCKKCGAAYVREWKAKATKEERDRQNEVQRRWRERNPEKVKSIDEKRRNNPKYAARTRRTQLRIKFGLTPEQYDEMLERQNHQCAICKTTEMRRKGDKHAAIDHCHKTGQVRGLLCPNCNHGLGKFKDSIEILQAAIKYLDDAQIELLFGEETQRCVKGYGLVAQSAA